MRPLRRLGILTVVWLMALAVCAAGTAHSALIPLPVSVGGSWATVGDAPVKSIHATVLHNGKVLLIEGSANDPVQFAAGTFKTSVWNPSTGQFADVVTPRDMFCGGHMSLASGEVLIGGGTAAYPTADHYYFGSASSFVFDPTTNTFEQVGDMADGHWYPTLTGLGDGRALALGGIDDTGQGSMSAEIYDPASRRWNRLPSGHERFWGLYPNMVLMRDGRLFYSGESTFASGLPPTIYNWQANSTSVVPGLTFPGRDQGATILLPPAQNQKVMVLGGKSLGTGLPVADTNIVDLRVASPTYTSAARMPVAKMYVERGDPAGLHGVPNGRWPVELDRSRHSGSIGVRPRDEPVLIDELACCGAPLPLRGVPPSGRPGCDTGE